MQRPRVTTAMVWDREAPDCPHCGGEMGEARVSLDDIITHWPLAEWVQTPGGWADPDRQLTVECPTCQRLSGFAVAREQGSSHRLVACCTAKDRAVRGEPQPPSIAHDRPAEYPIDRVHAPLNGEPAP
jgi:endogenous inhibitor of DNA gyrase (YacG/DUF329 family)